MTIKQTIEFIKDVSNILPVKVSLTPFIPKPRTPFEKYEIDDKKNIRDKIFFFRNSVSRFRRVKISFDGVKTAHRQALFAKGDESVLFNEAKKHNII